MPSMTSVLIGTAVVGAVGGIGYLIYKDEERFSKLTPEQQHQERMDRLKEQVAYALVSKI